MKRKKRKKLWLRNAVYLLAGWLGCFPLLSQPAYAASLSTWIQADWSQGIGESTDNQYKSASHIDVSEAGVLRLDGAADWFDGDWGHRRAVNITNVGGAQVDYPVRIIIPYHEAMQADFSDLRFVDESGEMLHYWFQSVEEGVSAVVWLKVPELDAESEIQIDMYFGNDEAENVSSGNDVFMLFDDFDDGEINMEKWVEVDISSDEISEADGKLVFKRLSNGSWNKAVYAAEAFERDNIMFEFDYQWVVNNPAYDAIMFGWHDVGSAASYSSLIYALYNAGSGSANTVGVNIYEDGSSRSGVQGSWVVGTDYDVRIVVDAGGGASYEYREAGTEEWTVAYDSGHSTETPLKPGWSFYSGTHHFDNARVRKWMAEEPAVDFGELESRYASEGSLVSNIFDTTLAGCLWGNLEYEIGGSGEVALKVRSSKSAEMAGATSFSQCSDVQSGTDLSDSDCVSDGDTHLQYMVTLQPEGALSPTLTSFSAECVPTDPQLIANAGPDRLVVAGRSVMIDGSRSFGRDLVYNWAIIAGGGYLEGETTTTPTYHSIGFVEEEKVTIYLTVRDSLGNRSTDEVTVHVYIPIDGVVVKDTIAGVISGQVIYERIVVDGDAEKVLLTLGDAIIALPNDVGRYTFAMTRDNRLVIGLPDADSGAGRVYFVNQPIEDISGTTNLEDVSLFSVSEVVQRSNYSPTVVTGEVSGDLFGQYVAVGDLDGDGTDEVLVASPGEAPYGRVYIFNSNAEMTGVLVGSGQYPIRSVMVNNLLEGNAGSIILAPGNTAMRMDLFKGSLSAPISSSGATIISGDMDLTGVTIIDSVIITSTVCNNHNHLSMAVGDLNGDTKDDLILSTEDGNVEVYFGPIAKGANLTEGDADVIVSGSEFSEMFGHVVAVGDVNGDGCQDLVVGSPAHGDADVGSLYTIFGCFSEGTTIDIEEGYNVLRMEGLKAGDQLGSDLALADANSDGISEIYAVLGLQSVYKYDFSGDVSTGEESEPGGVEEEQPAAASASGGCSLSPVDSGKGGLLFILLFFVAGVVFRKFLM